MKEELKKSKYLLNSLNSKTDKLQKAVGDKNTQIDELRRQLAFYEGRFYSRLGVKRSNSIGEGNPSNELVPIFPNRQAEGDLEGGEDERMINVSMLDQSVVMDVSRVNKNSIIKRKRNNKGSINISKEPIMMKKSSANKVNAGNGPSFKLQFLDEMPREYAQAGNSTQELLEYEEIDHREAFKVEESKGYLRQLAKELFMDLNSKAKYTFSRMKNKKFIDFGLLPTPIIKIDRSVSCPSLSSTKSKIVNRNSQADTTLIFERNGQFPGGNGMLSDDYSIDYDFEELKNLIKKHA